MKNNNKFITSILTWIGLYPTLIIVSSLFGSILNDFPNYLRILILTIIVVPLMIYVIMSFLFPIVFYFANFAGNF